MFNLNKPSLQELQSEINTCKELVTDTYHIAMNDELTEEEYKAFALVSKYAANRQTKFEAAFLNSQFELQNTQPTLRNLLD